MAAGEVDRCVCVNVTFREMKSHVDQHGGNGDSLRSHFGCGRGCALCVPYVRAMLATGRTAFAVNDAALPTTESAISPPAPSPPREQPPV